MASNNLSQSTGPTSSPRGKGNRATHRTLAFWLGTAALCAGVLLHLPDFFMYSPRFGGMTMDPSMGAMPISGMMIFGMLLIALGFGLAVYGLYPRREEVRLTHDGQHRFLLRTMDDNPMTWAQWRTAGVLVVALMVDVMKPATLGFIIPGARAEYGLTPIQIAMWPVVALLGTTVGSILWGMLADTLGRRTGILLASLMFVGTAICGVMPTYELNLLMCFFMGMSAGGMLPIEFALFSETMPRRKRGFLLVLTAGLGTAGGYLVASSASAYLDPFFGTWRILWLLGLPTGLLVIVLRSFIPESPRFLLSQGRVEEARRTMRSFGIVMEEAGVTPAGPAPAEAAHPRLAHYTGMGQLFKGPYLAQTMALVLLGVSWGLVNWGFITWLPALLKDAGLQAGSKVLAKSALFALPGTVLAACLYGWWSSKRTMVIFTAAVVAILAGFALFNTSIADHPTTLLLLMAGLLVASTGVISMLMPYAAEVYDTAFRGQGTGLIGAASKLAGIFGPSLVVAVVALWPGLTAPALLAAIPMALAAIVLGLKGIETRARRLEEIHAQQPYAQAPADAGAPQPLESVKPTPAGPTHPAPGGLVRPGQRSGPAIGGRRKQDVVIIGGGPGGAASAMFLAQEGVQAVIVEQERFPRFHVGESLTGAGGQVLQDLGLDAEMYRRRYPTKQGVRVYGNSARGSWFVPVTGRDADWQVSPRDTWQVRRSDFDKMLLDQALARGATLIPGKAIKPLLKDDGSVRGVQVRLKDGGSLELESELLLDCSGQATFLANAGVTGPKYLGNYDKQIAVFSQVAGALRDDGASQGAHRDLHKDNTLIFYQQKYHWAWFIPLDDDVVSVGVVVPADYFRGKKESKKDFLVRELHELHPELKRRIPEIKLVEDVHMVPNHSYQVRQFCGKGFVCIGDAHRFIDPIFSFGATVTMREAQLAAPLVKAYLEGAHRDDPNPFAQHQLLCEKGIDVLEDTLDLFWEQPLGFSYLVHSQHPDLMGDILGGRIYERQPSAAIHDLREMLQREAERERSYTDESVYSIPIGSRFHPERAPLWQAGPTVDSAEDQSGPG
jgi:putative MFS transporter